MSFVPLNLSTAVIIEKTGEEVNTLSVLFKVAYNFAQKGLIIYIFTKPLSDIPISRHEYLLQPSILERIHFRYFSTCEEIIQWCHQVHNLQIKPPVLLVSIKEFSKADDFRSLSVCAALLDAMIYFSKVLNTKQLYFLSLLITDDNSFIPNLFTFFNSSWLATIKCDSIELAPFQKKGDISTLKLDHNNSSFEDILRIFLN